ncbi:MAG TPA: hypothetical protein C5S50_05670 [Methanosarcinaceae archaeon]|nr:hypothetical protein [Methanosarcinaceae archaeon]
MTKLGQPISPEIEDIKVELHKVLIKRQIEEIDAESVVTGKDFLMKIWNLITTVPLGIAIIGSNMSGQTLSNIFYEIGFMQACGKETLIIKTKDAKIPSDFIRTEYVEYGNNFENKLDKFFNTFFALPEYYDNMAEVLENNPLLAIDYLRRAYLITGDAEYKDKANIIYENASIDGRAKNSVEALLIKF